MVSKQSWEQTVAETLDRFIDGYSAWNVVCRADRSTPPREFLGEGYLRIIRSRRCRDEFPKSTEIEVQKRVWAIATYHLRNAVRQVFSGAEQDSVTQSAMPPKADYGELDRIEELVRELPEPLQSVVRLRLDAKTLTDIAAIRGVCVGTISRQFQKAVELLKVSAASN